MLSAVVGTGMGDSVAVMPPIGAGVGVGAGLLQALPTATAATTAMKRIVVTLRLSASHVPRKARSLTHRHAGRRFASRCPSRLRPDAQSSFPTRYRLRT